jgi:hypothetical protein
MHREGARSGPFYDGVGVEREKNFSRRVDGSDRRLRKMA